jgi:hypothetical protein
MKDQPQMHQFYKEMAELHVGFQIVNALEKKYIFDQAKSELAAEAKNHEKAELIAAAIQELIHINQRILKSEELWDHVTQAKAEVNYNLKDLLNTEPENKVRAYLEILRRGGKPDIDEIIGESAKLAALKGVKI